MLEDSECSKSMPVLVKTYLCRSFSHEPRGPLSDSGGLVLWWLSKWWDNDSLVLTITYISLFPGFPLIGMSLHPASSDGKYYEREEGKDRHLLPRELWQWRAGTRSANAFRAPVLSWSAITRRQFPARQESFLEFRHLSLLCNSPN